MTIASSKPKGSCTRMTRSLAVDRELDALLASTAEVYAVRHPNREDYPITDSVLVSFAIAELTDSVHFGAIDWHAVLEIPFSPKVSHADETCRLATLALPAEPCPNVTFDSLEDFHAMLKKDLPGLALEDSIRLALKALLLEKGAWVVDAEGRAHPPVRPRYVSSSHFAKPNVATTHSVVR